MTKKNVRDERLYLEDMITSIEKVLAYTHNLDFEKFDNSEITKDAVLLNLQIVGEAAGKISEATRLKYPHIPWRDMAAFRIIVAHIYFSVDSSKIWELIINHLPGNLKDLKAMMK